MFKSLNFYQTTPDTSWVITHNFGYQVIVDVSVDVNGELQKILPTNITEDTNKNILSITFSNPVTGVARLITSTPDILSLTEAPPAEVMPFSPNTIEVNAFPLNSSISINAGEIQWLYFTLSSLKTVSINISNSNFTVNTVLYDWNGIKISEDSSGSFSQDLVSGTYYIGLTGYGSDLVSGSNFAISKSNIGGNTSIDILADDTNVDYIFLDNFNGIEGISVEDHTPDIYMGNDNWGSYPGTVLTSGTLNLDGTITEGHGGYATINLGSFTSNGIIVELKAKKKNGLARIFFELRYYVSDSYQDFHTSLFENTSNNWRLAINNISLSNPLTQPDSNTSIIWPGNIPYSDYNILRVEIESNTQRIFLNGLLEHTTNLSLLSLASVDNAYLWISTLPSNNDYDNTINNQYVDYIKIINMPSLPSDELILPSSTSITLPHSSSGSHSENEIKWYSFTVNSSVQITIDLTNSDYDTILALYNSSGVKVAENDDFAGSPQSKIITSIIAGTYYFASFGYVDNYITGVDFNIVAPSSETGNYVLHVSAV